MRSSTPAFSRILKDSFEGENSQRMWCDRCRRYQPVQSWETIQSVPSILMINTGLSKQTDARHLWSIPGWLPERIGLVVEKGRILCLEGEALRAAQRNRQSRLMVVYDLVGLVADVNSGEHQKSHMVSLINGKDTPFSDLLSATNSAPSRDIFARAASRTAVAPVQ